MDQSVIRIPKPRRRAQCRLCSALRRYGVGPLTSPYTARCFRVRSYCFSRSREMRQRLVCLSYQPSTFLKHACAGLKAVSTTSPLFTQGGLSDRVFMSLLRTSFQSQAHRDVSVSASVISKPVQGWMLMSFRTRVSLPIKRGCSRQRPTGHTYICTYVHAYVRMLTRTGCRLIHTIMKISASPEQRVEFFLSQQASYHL